MRETEYTLDENGIPVPCEDVEEWCEWMTDNDFVVGRDFVEDCLVQTSFGGTDLSTSEFGPPLPFVTNISGGPLQDYCAISGTWEEAEAEHRLAMEKCEAVFAAIIARLTGEAS